MKYLRQENNRFFFEDGGEELELVYSDVHEIHEFTNGNLAIEMDGDDFGIYPIRYANVLFGFAQTAVQMMTILKEKGLV